MEILTRKQAAELWGISPRRVALLRAQGRIPGTVKAGKIDSAQQIIGGVLMRENFSFLIYRSAEECVSLHAVSRMTASG